MHALPNLLVCIDMPLPPHPPKHEPPHPLTDPRLQDLGAKSLADAWRRLDAGEQRLEGRTGAAQAEGGIHDMHTFDKKSW